MVMGMGSTTTGDGGTCPPQYFQFLTLRLWTLHERIMELGRGGSKGGHLGPCPPKPIWPSPKDPSFNITPMAVHGKKGAISAICPPPPKKTSGWIRPCSWRLVTGRFRGRVSVSKRVIYPAKTRFYQTPLSKLLQH